MKNNFAIGLRLYCDYCLISLEAEKFIDEFNPEEIAEAIDISYSGNDFKSYFIDLEYILVELIINRFLENSKHSDKDEMFVEYFQNYKIQYKDNICYIIFYFEEESEYSPKDAEEFYNKHKDLIPNNIQLKFEMYE